MYRDNLFNYVCKMKKKMVIFVIIYTIIGTVAYGQRDSSIESFVIEFQKVVFVTSDSTYKFTRFITPDGIFYFRDGFINSNDTARYSFSGSGGVILKHGNYMVSYKSVSDDIDTIYSYFPFKEIEYFKLELSEDLFMSIEELKYSYVLKQIRETEIISSSNNTIRIIYPYEHLNYCTLYRIVTIKIFADSVKIYGVTAQSVDHNGIQLTRTDSALLKARDVKNLKKHLNLIKSTPEMTCRRPGNPWILEYNDGSEYKRYIVSYYCLREKRLKTIGPEIILGLGNKYFGRSW